jgi:hypothetical protein
MDENPNWYAQDGLLDATHPGERAWINPLSDPVDGFID